LPVVYLRTQRDRRTHNDGQIDQSHNLLQCSLRSIGKDKNGRLHPDHIFDLRFLHLDHDAEPRIFFTGMLIL